MQDNDLFDGVDGKYTDSFDENTIKKSDDMEIATKTTTAHRPPGLGYRHLQIVLLFLGLFMAYALRVNISVGIVAMVKSENKTTDPAFETYSWDKSQQGLILSSFFWGYLLAQVPVSHLAQSDGAKILLTFASIVCALLTLITPWAASIDWKCILLTRALQGLFQGFYYPCVHTLLAKWIHPSERGVLTTFTYSGTQAGSVVMLGISGFLAQSTFGWPSIYYVSGGGTLLWTIVWAVFGASSPSECARISIEEKKFIESMPGSSHTHFKTPWSRILRSTPVIALIIVHACQCWGFWTLLTETPSYLEQIFHFEIKTNALISALPYLAMWVVSLAVSPISDYLVNRGHITVRTGRKLFNSFGHWVPAITLIILPFLRDPTQAIIMLTMAIGFNGFTYCGYICNHMDLSPNFAGALMGLTNSLANIMSILGPITVGFILTDNHDVDVKYGEWKLVFFIAAGFYFGGNLLFVIFGKAEIQSWNEADEMNKSTSEIDTSDKHGSNVNIFTVSNSVK